MWNNKEDNNDLPLQSNNTWSQQYGEPPLKSNNTSEIIKLFIPWNDKSNK